MDGQRPVLHWQLDDELDRGDDLAVDIEREGVTLTVDDPPPIGTSVDLALVTSDASADDVVLPATVRFVDPTTGMVGVAVDLSRDESRMALAQATKSIESVRQRAARRAVTLHDRLRRLDAAERGRIARRGDQAERVVLERIYGKAVWEELLQNPRITPPEVARIARMGAIPKPLLEVIAGNPGWLTSGQVRRALLSNPRLSRPLVFKVLKALPKHELRLMEKQTAYPKLVLALARDLLRGVSS